MSCPLSAGHSPRTAGWVLKVDMLCATSLASAQPPFIGSGNGLLDQIGDCPTILDQAVPVQASWALWSFLEVVCKTTGKGKVLSSLTPSMLSATAPFRTKPKLPGLTCRQSTVTPPPGTSRLPSVTGAYPMHMGVQGRTIVCF